MEDPWASQYKNFQVMRLYTGGGDFLKRPIPVVVIVGAECLGAVPDFLPNTPSEGHTHVVFRGDPVS